MQLFCDLRVHIECNKYVLSMRTSLDFHMLSAKTNIAKESSAVGCKYIDKSICNWVFFVNKAWIPILRSYKGLRSVRFDPRVVCEFERNTSKGNRSFATVSLSSTVALSRLKSVISGGNQGPSCSASSNVKSLSEDSMVTSLISYLNIYHA